MPDLTYPIETLDEDSDDGTTDGYTKWHVYADMGDVLELTVGWSCGNPFYYGYGFHITVLDVDE